MHSNPFTIICIKISIIITLVSWSPLQAMEESSLEDRCNSWITSLKSYIDNNDKALLNEYFHSIVTALETYKPIERLEAYLWLLKKTKKNESSLLINKLCKQLNLIGAIYENELQKTPLKKALIEAEIQEIINQLATHHSGEWINKLKQKYCDEKSEPSQNNDCIIPPLINISNTMEENLTIDFDFASAFDIMEEILFNESDQDPRFLFLFDTIEAEIYKQDPDQQIKKLVDLYNEFHHNTPLVARKLYDFSNRLRALYSYDEETTPPDEYNNPTKMATLYEEPNYEFTCKGDPKSKKTKILEHIENARLQAQINGIPNLIKNYQDLDKMVLDKMVSPKYKTHYSTKTKPSSPSPLCSNPKKSQRSITIKLGKNITAMNVFENTLLTSDQNSIVKCYSLNSGELERTFASTHPHPICFYSGIAQPSDDTLRLEAFQINYETLKLATIISFITNPKPIHLVTHNNQYLILGHSDGSLTINDCWFGLSHKTLQEKHEAAITTLLQYSDYEFISGSKDGTIKKWNMEQQEFCETITQGLGTINSMAMIKNVIYAITNKNSIIACTKKQPLLLHKEEFMEITALATLDSLLIAGLSSGNITIFNTNVGFSKPIILETNMEAPIKSLLVHKENKLITRYEASAFVTSKELLTYCMQDNNDRTAT